MLARIHDIIILDHGHSMTSIVLRGDEKEINIQYFLNWFAVSFGYKYLLKQVAK